MPPAWSSLSLLIFLKPRNRNQFERPSLMVSHAVVDARLRMEAHIHRRFCRLRIWPAIFEPRVDRSRKTPIVKSYRHLYHTTKTQPALIHCTTTTTATLKYDTQPVSVFKSFRYLEIHPRRRYQPKVLEDVKLHEEDKISILFIQISFGSTKAIPVSGGDVYEIVRIREE